MSDESLTILLGQFICFFNMLPSLSFQKGLNVLQREREREKREGERERARDEKTYRVLAYHRLQKHIFAFYSRSRKQFNKRDLIQISSIRDYHVHFLIMQTTTA